MYRRNVFFITVFFVMAFFLLMATAAFAQESGGFDWGGLGVNLGIVGAIIAIVQMFKQYIPDKFVVFAPILLSVAAFFLVGGNQPAENVIYWAAAAGYLWKIANTITPEKVLKSKSVLEK